MKTPIADGNVKPKRRHLIAAGLVALMLVPAAGGLWQQHRLTNPQREHAMTELTSRMKTVCFGRYLVDIPAEAEFSIGTAYSDSNKIERIPKFADDRAYREHLKEREQHLRAAKHDTEGSLLRSVVQMNGGQHTAFVSRPNDHTHRLSLVETFVNLKSNAYHVSYTTAEEYLTITIQEIERIARSLKNHDGTIPAAPGACIDSGLLELTPTEVETFSAGAHMSSLSWSISFSTETSGPREPGATLHDRVDRAIEMAGAGSGIRKLRRANVAADGRSGQEYVGIYPGEQGVEIFDAKLEVYGSGKPQQATIKMHMEAGRVVKPDPSDPRKFLTQDEALALWDAVVKSVRLRSGAF
jgi:Tle cognate immunity protein 4 C-terminal domain/Tle cognate immunity protein 4 N-terminal domain